MSELDDALARFQLGGFEYAGGLSNHGPMAAEALVALGHPSLIPALVDIYAPRLRPLEPGAPIPPAGQAEALGRGRAQDWLATFEAEIAARAWQEVLADWLPRLLPGLFAAATHGLLRTAHGVRALGREQTPQRRRELAFGLAYWAARHQLLPGRPGARPRAGRGPAEALHALTPVAASRRRPGLLSEAVGVLDDEMGYRDAVESLDPRALPFSQALSELCACAAGLYLAHPEWRIAYAHCVTGPSALRLLAPFLDDAQRAVALGHAVQAVAALHATHGSVEPEAVPPADAELSRLAGEGDEMRYRAACSLEEHAIKLSEACLREDAVRPDPRLRLAAADASTRLGVSRGGRGG